MIFSAASLGGIEKIGFRDKNFEVVKTAFWQGHFFVGTPLLRTRAVTRALDATSRKRFFRRYCKEPTTTFVVNDFDNTFLIFGANAPAAMGGILRQIVPCFRITLQANALRVTLRASRSTSHVTGQPLYKTLYEPTALQIILLASRSTSHFAGQPLYKTLCELTALQIT